MGSVRYLRLSVLILSSCVLTASAYYHPDQGRWISRDPLGDTYVLNRHLAAFQREGASKREITSVKSDSRLFLYSFVKNRPVDRLDNLGLRMWRPGPVPGTDIKVRWLSCFCTVANEVADWILFRADIDYPPFPEGYRDGRNPGDISHCVFGCVLSMITPFWGVMSVASECVGDFAWGDLGSDLEGALVGISASDAHECVDKCVTLNSGHSQ